MTQSVFAAAVLDPAKPIPAGLVDPRGNVCPKRFDVYRNNVAVGLMRALETGFPVIRRLVGDDFFAAMARVYVRAHPPTSRLMMFYGTDLPSFLAQFPPVAHLPYLPDIARLELAIRHAYHAADAAPLPSDVLAQQTPQAFLKARLRFAPAFHLVASVWPIHAIWLANTDPTAPKPVIRPESVAVFRPGFDPVIALLPPHAAGFLADLCDGQTVEAALQTHPVELDFLLPLIVQNNALVGLA